MNQFTEENLVRFWTLTENHQQEIYSYHSSQFEEFYRRQIGKIYGLGRSQRQNFSETKFYHDFINRLDELKKLIQETFISSFSLDNNNHPIYCMDGTIAYGMDDDQLTITSVTVLPERRRQGIFTNFLFFVSENPEINSILITDISDQMSNLLSKTKLLGTGFEIDDENNALWVRP